MDVPDIDVITEHWQDIVRRASAGDISAARACLEEFFSAVEQVAHLKDPPKAWKGPIPWQIAEYFAESFREMLRGKEPAKALNLVGKTAGRRKGIKTTLNLEALAAAFWILRRHGLTVEKANEELAREVGADRSTTSRARNSGGNPAFKYPKLVKDSALEELAKPYSTQIATIIKRYRVNPPKSRSRKRPG